MNIKDDLNLHSIILDKALKDIENIRQRIQDMSQTISVHSYMLEQTSEVHKKIINSIKENAEMIDKLNIELFQRRTVLDFISEKLSSTKTLTILFCAFLVAEALSVTPLIFKHFLGW